MKPPLRCVIDASVAIKLFVEEPLSDEADRLFTRLADQSGARFFVPTLFHVECANILWKCVRRYDYPARKVLQSLDRLKALALTPIPLISLVTPAFRLAVRYEVTAYDGCYLATASLVGAPLITADEKLCRKLSGGSIRVFLLGHY